MNYVKTAFFKGSVAALRCPSIGEKMQIPESMCVFPARDKGEVNQNNREQIEGLLERHNARISLPTTTLLTLVNTNAPCYNEEWCIPFSVISSEQGNKVIFELPIRGGPLTTREAYRFIYETCLMKICKTERKLPIEEILKKNAETNSINSTSCSSRNETDNKDILESAKNASDTKGCAHAFDHTPDSHLKDQNSHQWPHFARVVKDAESSPRTGVLDCLFESYDVWHLGQLNLISITDHSDVIFSSSPSANEEPFFILPYPKIELQINHGFEKFSLSELCQMWWKMFLFQPSKILCCRLNPGSSSVEDIRFYTMSDLTGTGSPFNPLVSQKYLHDLLRVTVDLAPGEYIMNHKSGKTSAGIYQECIELSTTDEDVYNVVEEMEACIGKNWPVDTSRLEWLPIDPWQPTSRHAHAMRVPCTFPIDPEAKQQSWKRGKNSKKKSKKANRKKMSMNKVGDVAVVYEDSFF